ncbi:MAG: patatin-like phospholipase family protein [Thermonemataceae bacterium]
MPRKSHPKKIKIALQGGGAHGAYTWGVLHRLLEEPSLEFTGISGTSAGAMNAAIMLTGLERKGKEAAKENLERFWFALHKAGAFNQGEKFNDLFGNYPFWSVLMELNYQLTNKFWKKVSSLASLSPYEFNPLDINPLRDIVAELADFDLLNKSKRALWIAATNVHTGQLRLFTKPAISLDVVMASACLPEVYKAVEIEGSAYWDGGYTSNPPLLPLVQEETSVDLVLIQINPFVSCDTPKGSGEIMSRMNQINFNNSLLKELYNIAALKRIQHLPNIPKREIRLHRIEAEERLRDYGLDSKYDTRWSFLKELHDIGYETAEAWLNENLDKVGQQDSFDIDQLIAKDIIEGLSKGIPLAE